ncbi:putative glycerol-3-phosphate acyltransferase PlsX [Alkalihalophilus pseudofirmus OF4]|uniref:Phosphate acyltransferase n=1 Tax=Alkalihalophilus pseudofirmus (strain ATCC BAA-2126 / JCM 17055 / OF4) TaxID=398511 RepID=D3FT74_ALKPO|nr:phosphate acyltransferase PlsX [Alkalihalophilus pseudofirmus]ADC48142.1 putative glycerol-3-phosphate acyltransferase PlsX [Alkalihalophilus pseudofirmus OF4]
MRIAIDAMGGDHAPRAQVAAAEQAVKDFSGLEITLVGNESDIRPHLKDDTNITILHTTEKIEDTDQPTTAVRRKKEASMVLGVREVREGRADASISAGNTGALMTAGLLHVGRIKGIDRPALAPKLPTLDGNGFLLLDVGANMDAKPEQLLQYAIIGNTYMEKVQKVKKPRVGLLNVGTESGKGNELTKEAFPLLEAANFHFIGNVEARDLMNGVADVVVCDGFAGNLVLKTIEGTAGTLFSLLKKELTKSVKNKLAAGMLKSSFKDIKSQLSYSEYGGAGLFGLKAPVIKAHGSSDEVAVYHAIRQARQMAEEQVTTIIETEVAAINSTQSK